MLTDRKQVRITGGVTSAIVINVSVIYYMALFYFSTILSVSPRHSLNIFWFCPLFILV